MAWSIWQMLRNTEIIQDETKKEIYKKIIKDLKNFSPLNYPPNTMDDLIKKYEGLLKEIGK